MSRLGKIQYRMAVSDVIKTAYLNIAVASVMVTEERIISSLSAEFLGPIYTGLESRIKRFFTRDYERVLNINSKQSGMER